MEHATRIDALVHIVQSKVKIVENFPHQPDADHAVVPLRAPNVVGFRSATNPVQEVGRTAGGIVCTRS